MRAFALTIETEKACRIFDRRLAEHCVRRRQPFVGLPIRSSFSTPGNSRGQTSEYQAADNGFVLSLVAAPDACSPLESGATRKNESYEARKGSRAS